MPAVTVRAALHEPFVPSRARRVATVVGVAQAVVLVGVAVALPGGPAGFGVADRLGVVAVAAAVGWMMFRFARVRALPSEQGLTVHNLVRTTQLAWAQIVAVRFGGGEPWVTLDLADGETLAVMAVQRADGPPARAQAQRLATLVALHSRTSSDD